MINGDIIRSLTPEKKAKLLEIIESRGSEINVYPMSSEQMKMWYLYMLAPDIPYYNCCYKFVLKHDIDEDKLRDIIYKLVKAHDILRTMYFSVNGKSFQTILDDGFDIEFVYLEDEGFDERFRKEMAYTFRLDKELPLRILRHGNELYLQIHHIANDGWSVGVIMNDLIELMKGHELNKKYQYLDYCIWQKKFRKGEEFANALRFWKEYLKDCSEYLDMPLDYPRGNSQNYRGKALSRVLGRDSCMKLRKLSADSSVTMYSILAAALFVLMSRFAGQEDINIGTPLINRIRPEFQDIVGCFTNTAVVRGKVDSGITFTELAENVQKDMKNILAAQCVPFEDVVKEVKAKRHDNYSVLYQVFFSFQNKTLLNNQYGEVSMLDNDLISLEPLDTSVVEVTQNDLFITVREAEDDEIILGFSYNTAIFREETAEKLAECYEGILKQAADCPDIVISDIKTDTAANDSCSDDDISGNEENTDENSADTEDISDIREKVRNIWAKVLDSSSFGDDDNFFDAGGNSMNCLELMELLNDTFGISLTIADLFIYNTVSQTSAYIAENQSAGTEKDTDTDYMMF